MVRIAPCSTVSGFATRIIGSGFSLLGMLCLFMAAVSLVAADNGSLRKAPELAFNIPGQGPKLLSQYRGKVVALEFIFTTCPHCQAASKVMR